MSKAGRPSKLDTISLDQVRKLAAYGLTELEISDVLDINQDTLQQYKKTPEFSEAINAGKAVSDNKVIKSLYERALGYDRDGKHYPGDTTACIFWLKNRRRGEWSDRREVIEMRFIYEFVSRVGAAINKILPNKCPHCKTLLDLKPIAAAELERVSRDVEVTNATAG